MKRRRAVQNIVIISSGVFLVPSCRLDRVALEYENLPLRGSDKKTIRVLTESILPLNDLPVENPETATDFVLTMVNDCASPEHIDQYMAGLKEINDYVKSQFNTSFVELDETQNAQVLEYLSGSEEPSPELKMFYQTTRRYTIQHFTGSEYFMTNYLNYEMAPGRFIGCVEI